jgi:hypothetical protein
MQVDNVLLEWLLALQARPTRSTSPGAALPLCTAVGCHHLPFLGDLHSNIAVTAVMFSQHDSAAPG